MTITIDQFLKNIAGSGADVYLLYCTDIVVYDSGSRVVYIPEATFRSATLSPMGDLRTHVGHNLLWSQHAVVEGSSQDMYDALVEAGYTGQLHDESHCYKIYRLVKPAPAGARSA